MPWTATPQPEQDKAQNEPGKQGMFTIKTVLVYSAVEDSFHRDFSIFSRSW